MGTIAESLIALLFVFCRKNIFYPLTSLDIVCHEIGHAVTQWHGGNLEYWKQSGAMNEAYSDILGKGESMMFAYSVRLSFSQHTCTTRNRVTYTYLAFSLPI